MGCHFWLDLGTRSDFRLGRSVGGLRGLRCGGGLAGEARHLNARGGKRAVRRLIGRHKNLGRTSRYTDDRSACPISMTAADDAIIIKRLNCNNTGRHVGRLRDSHRGVTIDTLDCKFRRQKDAI